DGGRAADGGGGHGRDPVARVAHRPELPALELLGRGDGERAQVLLQARLEVLGRVDGTQGLPQQGLELGGALAHLMPPWSGLPPCARAPPAALWSGAAGPSSRRPCAPAPARSRGCPSRAR